jgi:hypothetical protein
MHQGEEVAGEASEIQHELEAKENYREKYQEEYGDMEEEDPR